MATSREIRQLVQILDEEGFGSLAGEILAEINLGREMDRERGTKDGYDQTIVRLPIPENQQLFDAIELLRLRLVEPVRAFAQAERIAGMIVDAPPIRIRFIDPDERSELEPISRLDPGNSHLADKLDEFLHRLPQMLEPDTTAGP